MTTPLQESGPIDDMSAFEQQLESDPRQHIGGIVTAAELLATEPEPAPSIHATGKVTASNTKLPTGDTITDYDTEENE